MSTFTLVSKVSFSDETNRAVCNAAKPHEEYQRMISNRKGLDVYSGRPCLMPQFTRKGDEDRGMEERGFRKYIIYFVRLSESAAQPNFTPVNDLGCPEGII